MSNPLPSELRENIKQIRSNNRSLGSVLEPAAIDEIMRAFDTEYQRRSDKDIRESISKELEHLGSKSRLAGDKFDVLQYIAVRRRETSEYNLRMFGGNREAAIQRDGEKCVKCGMTRDEHQMKYKKDITVDHIDNQGTTKPSDQRNNNLENLQTLCMRCHASKDHKYRKLTDMQVVNIRHMKGSMTNVAVAHLYGVSEAYIGQIMRNKWRRVSSLTPELSSKGEQSE